MNKNILVWVFCFGSIHLFGQSYIWSEFNKGVYVSDYELNNKKLIIPSPYLFEGDIEWDDVHQELFTKSANNIRVFNDQGELEDLLSVRYFQNINHFEIDPLKRMIYMIAGDDYLISMDYEGNNRDTLLIDIENYHGALGYNPQLNQLYFATGEHDQWTYHGFDIETRQLVNILFSTDDARGLNYDASTHSIYYSDIDNRLIKRRRLSGSSSASTLYNYESSGSLIYSLEVDGKRGMLYFQPLKSNDLYSLDLVSYSTTKMFDYELNINEIAPGAESMYFFNFNYAYPSIHKHDYGSASSSAFIEGADDLIYFGVDHSNDRLIGSTRFGALQSFNLKGEFLEEHKPDGLDEIIDIEFVDGYYYLNDGRNIYKTNSDFEELEKLVRQTNLSPDKMVYNPIDNKLYIATKWSNQIYRINLDGSDYERFFSISPEDDDGEYGFTDIAYSAFTDAFYLTCRGEHLLVKIPGDGASFEVLYEGDFNDDFYTPMVDPTGRYLYYQASDVGLFYKTDLSTNQRTVFYDDDGYSSLTLDENGSLYVFKYNDSAIYALDESGTTLLYQDTIRTLGGAFMVSQDNILTGFYGQNKAILLVDRNTGLAEEHLYRNDNYLPSFYYHEPNGLMYGRTHVTFSGSGILLTSLNPETNDIEHYADLESSPTVLLPDQNTAFYLEENSNILEENTIIKIDLTTGVTDSLYALTGFSDRYTSMILHPEQERIYISSRSDEPMISIALDGGDRRVENYEENSAVFLDYNPGDGLFTIDVDFSENLVKRWNPNTGEISYHGQQAEDQSKNCFHVIPEYYNQLDEDGDGYSFIEDCDDSDAGINPGASEIPDNDIDENCDGIVEITDEDGDGIGVNFDCDDTNAEINPYAEEIPNNDIDEDCDGEALYIDEDGDGFNSDEDCDDTDAGINPGQAEIPNNDIDENCDGILEGTDEDGDGFWITEDCNDLDPTINPNAEEIPYNGIDDDCNEDTPDDDLDGDGFNIDEDCDDQNAEVNSGASEIPYNGIDDDCNEDTPDDDLDGDGFNADEDCEDLDPEINPGEMEIPYNGIDEDCNEDTPDDDLDGDGFNMDEDCDDLNPDINPDAEEIIGNGIDEDCDEIDPQWDSIEWEGKSIDIYPNPADTKIFIKSSEALNVIISLYDSSGKSLSQTRGQEMDVSYLVSGIYFLQIKDDSGNSKMFKWIVI